jgi:hypothetical protein
MGRRYPQDARARHVLLFRSDDHDDGQPHRSEGVGSRDPILPERSSWPAEADTLATLRSYMNNSAPFNMNECKSAALLLQGGPKLTALPFPRRRSHLEPSPIRAVEPRASRAAERSPSLTPALPDDHQSPQLFGRPNTPTSSSTTCTTSRASTRNSGTARAGRKRSPRRRAAWPATLTSTATWRPLASSEDRSTRCPLRPHLALTRSRP